MGLVGKLKKAAKKVKWSPYSVGERLRRKFERRTNIGRTIKGMYNPQRSASSINSAGAAIPAHAGSSRSISSMM